MTSDKAAVREFWDREACGERYGEKHERLRYEREPEIFDLADFEARRGDSVLEIGVGMGSDFVRWLRAGARATGVDLTERAVAFTARRVAAEGFEAEVQLADAEDLPFADNTFDVVYSWGVLHHTPDTRCAFHEAVRVLKPGGVLKVMVYHRHSWVAAAAWVRHCLLRGRPARSLRRAVGEIESPGTQAFTVTEARSLVGSLDDVTVRPRVTYWDRHFAPILHHVGGDHWGWFLLIEGRKPLSA